MRHSVWLPNIEFKLCCVCTRCDLYRYIGENIVMVAKSYISVLLHFLFYGNNTRKSQAKSNRTKFPLDIHIGDFASVCAFYSLHLPTLMVKCYTTFPKRPFPSRMVLTYLQVSSKSSNIIMLGMGLPLKCRLSSIVQFNFDEAVGRILFIEVLQ